MCVNIAAAHLGLAADLFSSDLSADDNITHYASRPVRLNRSPMTTGVRR